jgi:Zn-dependent M28 family amino/carboxypeptidase
MLALLASLLTAAPAAVSPAVLLAAAVVSPAALLTAAPAAVAPAALLTAAPAAASPEALLTADSLRGHIRFLASDLLEGRGPATRGDQLAQAYLAAQFEVLGLKPAAPGGGWFQKVELVSVEGSPGTLSFAGQGGKALSLKRSEDFIAVSGHQQAQSQLTNAELVFAGFGIVAPEYQWDDFKGTELAGKVIVVMNNDPEDDPKLFAGKTRLWYGRWDYKYEQAARAGAAGCIIIHTTPSAGYPWQVVQTSWSGEQFDLPATAGTPTLQLRGWTTEEATKRLMALAGKDLDALRKAAQGRDFKPVPLGVTLSTSFKNTVQTRSTANVLGLLEGSDPKLKAELVVLTAHHDHLGRKEGVKEGDAIYNGAVDNASGSAVLLTLARAFAAMPRAPKRSILFAAVAAEEQGLLGSQYLVEHPPVPPAQMVMNLNIDGINIWGRTRDLSVIGMGKSTLDAVLVRLAKAQGRTARPDQNSDRGFFYRSDQFNFARRGVPSAYFSSGNDFLGRPEGWGRAQREQWEATRYHQPSDELTDAWDFTGAVEDLKLDYGLALEIANTTSPPVWVKGDEFEGARLASQKSAGASAP